MENIVNRLIKSRAGSVSKEVEAVISALDLKTASDFVVLGMSIVAYQKIMKSAFGPIMSLLSEEID